MKSLERRAWTPAGQTLRDVACNLCGSPARRHLAEENGLGVVRCRACGLVYVTPQPTPAELARFYAQYFREESEEDWRRVMGRAYAADAARLAAAFGTPGRVLDVGTGFGHFLELMRTRGWEVAGVESSSVAVERLRAKGFTVYAGAVPDVPLPQAHFDAVTLSSVLEHVADPLAVLAQATACLRPGGVLLARVPNLQLLGLFFPLRRFERSRAVRALMRAVRREVMDEDNLFHVIDPPAHLYGFTQRTLRAALARVGLRDVTLEGDPMPVRGTALNAWIDGGVYRAAALLRALSGERLELSPNITAIARR